MNRKLGRSCKVSLEVEAKTTQETTGGRNVRGSFLLDFLSDGVTGYGSHPGFWSSSSAFHLSLEAAPMLDQRSFDNLPPQHDYKPSTHHSGAHISPLSPVMSPNIHPKRLVIAKTCTYCKFARVFFYDDPCDDESERSVLLPPLAPSPAELRRFCEC